MPIRDSVFTSPDSLRAKYRNPRNVINNIDEAASTGDTGSGSGGGVDQSAADSIVTGGALGSGSGLVTTTPNGYGGAGGAPSIEERINSKYDTGRTATEEKAFF